EAQIDPAFGERFRTSFLQPRRNALGAVLDRARSRGELPPGLSPGSITDIVFGTIWYRLLATRQQLEDQFAEELISALAGPTPAPTHPAGARRPPHRTKLNRPAGEPSSSPVPPTASAAPSRTGSQPTAPR